MPKYIDLGKQLVRLYRLNLTCEDVIKEFLLSAETIDVPDTNVGDTISRQAAIDVMCELMHHWFGGDPKDEIREIKRELGKLPPAQQEQIIYANMSDEEFERWLYEHGICNPNIHESIPCDVVPLLIDNAISELPTAQPEQRWIPVTERLPENRVYVLVTYRHEYGLIDHGITWYGGAEKKWNTSRDVLAWMPLPKPYRKEGEADGQR